MQNSEARRELQEKRSTKAGTEAWKQAEVKVDQRKPKGRRRTDMSHCEAEIGKKGNEETEAE